jgi:hypothetical protein
MNIYYITGMVVLWLLVLILVAILGALCFSLWNALIERTIGKDRKLFNQILNEFIKRKKELEGLKKKGDEE